VHAQNYAVAALQPMTRQHSYDEYSLGNGIMPIQWFIDTFSAIFYIIIYRYAYVLAIYMQKNHIIFPVFNFVLVFRKITIFASLAALRRPANRPAKPKKSFVRLTCENTKTFSLSSFSRLS